MQSKALVEMHLQHRYFHEIPMSLARGKINRTSRDVNVYLSINANLKDTLADKLEADQIQRLIRASIFALKKKKKIPS